MRAEIGAENWDQTPAKGWKIEKKLRQVGSIDKIWIMTPKGIPPEAIQKEDGCDLCKAGVRNKAFVCFRMLGSRACLWCVQNKLKCSSDDRILFRVVSIAWSSQAIRSTDLWEQQLRCYNAISRTKKSERKPMSTWGLTKNFKDLPTGPSL